MIHNIKWQLAKLGAWLINLWIDDQHDIDGDYVQSYEVLTEWFGDHFSQNK